MIPNSKPNTPSASTGQPDHPERTTETTIQGTAVTAAMSGTSTNQFSKMFRMNVATSVQVSADRSPTRGLRKLLYARRWRIGVGSGSSLETAHWPAVSRSFASTYAGPACAIHAVSHDPTYPPPETVDK